VNDPVKKTTDVTIDLGASGRLINAVTLDISPSETNYVRRVAVNVADDLATSSWRYVGGGSISRISTSIFLGSSDVISLSEQRSRYIKLSIINDDNPPLSVASDAIVAGPVIGLVFKVSPGSSYTLYYGNPNARQPEYDMSQLTAYIDQKTLPIASVGPESANAAYVAPVPPVVPYTESHAWVLNVALALLVLIVGAGVAWYLHAYVKAQPVKK